MAITKTLGGDRLGAGKKIKVELHNYERSTHDLGYVWRSTMACGTLVPFMSLVALPGDNFDINLETDVKTYPTLGPLFGSFKMQLDIFQCPIRLYQKELHNNKLGVGLNMNKIRLPLMDVTTNDLDPSLKNIPLEFQQIDQSSLLAYLGVRGNGMANGNAKTGVKRSYNAIPYIAYYDIYKNYYANKQEEIGYIIHSSNFTPYFIDIQYLEAGGNLQVDWESTNHLLSNNGGFDITTNDENANLDATDFIAILDNGKEIPLSNIYSSITQPDSNRYRFENAIMNVTITGFKFSETASNSKPQLEKFELKNIDEVREEILSTTDGVPYKINDKSKAPYNLPLQTIQDTGQSCSRSPQEGLAIKTYQSDIFNNWLSSEWLDGTNGINAITAVDTSKGYFNIDSLNLAKKVYDMLNRIAVSGGSYDDWLQAVWAHDSYTRAETPIYLGGLSKEVIFQEVISNSAAINEPLGTLAGRGALARKHVGGHISVRIDEPSYIIGIISLTPRIDYSQGNNWDVELTSIDDLHKPALDQIGFQELLTDRMAFWDVNLDETNDGYYIAQKFSAGKQPAWIDYMTNFNKCYGNFADPRSEMFMTLNRRYEWEEVNSGTQNYRLKIKDLTTYVDPSKYNYMFADTNLSAQNFWVQIASDIIARRKMSAKVMPNL